MIPTLSPAEGAGGGSVYTEPVRDDPCVREAL
jgi:hypothetical protein